MPVMAPLPFTVIVAVAPNPPPPAKLTVSVAAYPVPPPVSGTLWIGRPNAAHSASVVVVLAHTISASGLPMMTMPPPLAGIVGLVLWLNRIELCSMSPLYMYPRGATPPPSPLLRVPHTQL